MTWYLLLAFLPLMLMMLAMLVGNTLPPAYVNARRAIFARSSQDVWRALADIETHPSWRTNMVRIERLGPTRFREHYKHGAVTYAIDVEEAPVRRILRIADPDLPFGGRWIYELAIAGDQTELTITEDGVAQNPAARVMLRLMRGAAIDRFLSDLAAHLGVRIAIERAQPSPLVA